ncbi:MAG: hypothetical protein JSV86_13280 [Gemmatimonadota bacterium]|nr:MAG: hypothetical protein JSV86_13280 [Gemmatimonadota bacterium]
MPAATRSLPALWPERATITLRFPVTATVQIESEFVRREGITFNGEGEPDVSGNAGHTFANQAFRS